MRSIIGNILLPILKKKKIYDICIHVYTGFHLEENQKKIIFNFYKSSSKDLRNPSRTKWCVSAKLATEHLLLSSHQWKARNPLQYFLHQQTSKPGSSSLPYLKTSCLPSSHPISKIWVVSWVWESTERSSRSGLGGSRGGMQLQDPRSRASIRQGTTGRRVEQPPLSPLAAPQPRRGITSNRSPAALRSGSRNQPLISQLETVPQASEVAAHITYTTPEKQHQWKEPGCAVIAVSSGREVRQNTGGTFQQHGLEAVTEGFGLWRVPLNKADVIPQPAAATCLFNAAGWSLGYYKCHRNPEQRQQTGL